MRIRLLSLIVAVALLPLATADAEPQILGLLATDSAAPLRCSETECHAEFTAFCMEPDRASPGYMTAYAPIPRRDDIRVLARTASGETVALPAAALGFRTTRGFAAVRWATRGVPTAAASPPSMRTSRARCAAASGAPTITRCESSTTATGTA